MSMTEIDEQEAKYHEDRMSPLVGGTITGVILGVTEESEWESSEIWPGLKIKKADGTEVVLTFSRDPEQNGPGHLLIEAAT